MRKLTPGLIAISLLILSFGAIMLGMILSWKVETQGWAIFSGFFGVGAFIAMVCYMIWHDSKLPPAKIRTTRKTVQIGFNRYETVITREVVREAA